VRQCDDAGGPAQRVSEPDVVFVGSTPGLPEIDFAHDTLDGMKSTSLSITGYVFWVFGLASIIIGFAISKWYSFQIASGVDAYKTDYSALWTGIIFAVIAVILAYFLKRKQKWAYWTALAFSMLVVIGTVLALVEQGHLLYSIAGINLPLMRGIQGILALASVIALLTKGTRREIFIP
jgi:hypothetical protein